MKGFFLVFITSLICITNAYSYNGGIQKQFTPNIDINSAENKAKTVYFESEYSKQKAYYDSMQKCADKNKYYMPEGTGVDADGCFDIVAFIRSKTGVNEASYRGYISAAGDLKYFSAVDNRPRKGKGVFLADSLCNMKFSGSRAMRYNDMKYLMKKAEMPDLSKPVFVFESLSAISSDNAASLKEGESASSVADSNWTCSSYSTRALTNRYAPKVKTSLSSESRYVVTDSPCSADSYIVCVED